MNKKEDMQLIGVVIFGICFYLLSLVVKMIMDNGYNYAYNKAIENKYIMQNVNELVKNNKDCSDSVPDIDCLLISNELTKMKLENITPYELITTYKNGVKYPLLKNI